MAKNKKKNVEEINLEEKEEEENKKEEEEEEKEEEEEEKKRATGDACVCKIKKLKNKKY